MNKIVTSKEEILKVSKALIKEEGWKAINIRTVADKGNISIGSVYNYFKSKGDLVSSTIESIWAEIFLSHAGGHKFESFLDAIDYISEAFRRGNELYPGFFKLHAMSFSSSDKESGKIHMAKAQQHMKQNLLKVLGADDAVRADAFNDVLTPEALVDILFSNIFFSSMQGNFDFNALREMVKKLIY